MSRLLVSGGWENTASGDWSTVSGGQLNITSNNVSTVSGGLRNTASPFCRNFENIGRHFDISLVSFQFILSLKQLNQLSRPANGVPNMVLKGKITINPETAFYKRDQDFLTMLEHTINQNYSKRDFDLSMLSAGMGISKRQLQRKLKTLMGCAPSEYLRTFRLQKSLQLLSQGIPVREVSQAVGFSSQSYFASSFKAQFGNTPTEYQRLQMHSVSDETLITS